MENNISDRFIAITNLIKDTYLECIDAKKTIKKSEVYSYLESPYRVADIKYWIPIVWKILYSLNNDVDYRRHKNARISLVLCIKHYELLFSKDLQKFIYTNYTNNNCLEHNDYKCNMEELGYGKVDRLGSDDVDSNWLCSDDVNSGLLEFDYNKSNWLGSDIVDSSRLGLEDISINLLSLEDVEKSRKSASINYPLYESLNNAIIQFKRRVEKPLANSYELNISRKEKEPLSIEEIKPIDNNIYNTLTSPTSIDNICDNLINDYRKYFFKSSHKRYYERNNKRIIISELSITKSLPLLIKCIMWNRISIIFFPVIIIIFIIDYYNHCKLPGLYYVPFINDIFKSKQRIKERATINNILYSYYDINNILINYSSSNKEQLDNVIKNRISPKEFKELYYSDINLRPYYEFPAFNYEHISKILCNELNLSNELQPYILKFLKTSGSKLATLKGFSPEISTNKPLCKQLTAISCLCKFETFSKYSTNSEFSVLELDALDTLKAAFPQRDDDDFTYKTFIDLFETKVFSSINELLIYELLQINLIDRHLDRLLYDLYEIELRITLISIKQETVDGFSDYDTPITDTEYTITKVKFANALIKNFKAEDCRNFLDDIKNFDESSFKIFIKDFCHIHKIDYPYFKDDSEFLKYVFSTVLDLSVIELEHEFNKFWQYDFSMSYCKKSDIKPNSILKGVYRNSKK